MTKTTRIYLVEMNLDDKVERPPRLIRAGNRAQAERHVARSCIIDKWTEQGSHAAIEHTASAAPSGLGKAWRDVAKASGDVAKREMERLEQAVEIHRQTIYKLEQELRELRYPDRYPERIGS